MTFIGVVYPFSSLASRFSLCVYVQVYYCVFVLLFILLDILQASCICGLTSFIIFSKFWPLDIQIFSLPFFFFWDFYYVYVRAFDIVSQLLVALFWFFCGFVPPFSLFLFG